MAEGYENCPNALPVQLRYLSFGSSTSIPDMVTAIKNEITTPGLYIFNGSLYGHPAGYTAICACSKYQGGNDLVNSGTIYITDGTNVIVFTKDATKVVTITNP